MIYSCHYYGQICFNLAERVRNRSLCVTDSTAFELKKEVMMMNGKSDHTQKKARCQEQAYASSDKRDVSIV
jgi:hypothetical protein